MSRREIKTYTYHCDFCEREVDGAELPEGWGQFNRTFHDCGLTGYSRTESFDACDACYPEKSKGADKPGSRVY